MTKFLCGGMSMTEFSSQTDLTSHNSKMIQNVVNRLLNQKETLPLPYKNFFTEISKNVPVVGIIQVEMLLGFLDSLSAGGTMCPPLKKNP